MVENVSWVLLCAHGAFPKPEPEELCSWLSELESAYAMVQRLIEAMPAELRNESIRESHESLAAWTKVMANSIGWIQLAVRLDAPIPIPEAREFLAGIAQSGDSGLDEFGHGETDTQEKRTLMADL